MPEDFYRSHWQHIEDDRLARYERMFVWRPEQNALLERLQLSPGQQVLDFGCGPGFVTLEIARRVGVTGHAWGVDLNETFLQRARDRAAAEGIAAQVTYLQADGAAPLPDASIDRVLCKNVLEYVPDFRATLAAHLRLLRPGGMIHVADSDWGFLVVEPWTPAEINEMFAAAAGAFREPLIGRRLPGALTELGYVDVRVAIDAGADRDGRMRPVLENMAGYARSLGGMTLERATGLLARIDAALAAGTYLCVLPQFAITARKPG